MPNGMHMHQKYEVTSHGTEQPYPAFQNYETYLLKKITLNMLAILTQKGH